MGRTWPSLVVRAGPARLVAPGGIADFCSVTLAAWPCLFVCRLACLASCLALPNFFCAACSVVLWLPLVLGPFGGFSHRSLLLGGQLVTGVSHDVIPPLPLCRVFLAAASILSLLGPAGVWLLLPVPFPDFFSLSVPSLRVGLGFPVSWWCGPRTAAQRTAESAALSLSCRKGSACCSWCKHLMMIHNF